MENKKYIVYFVIALIGTLLFVYTQPSDLEQICKPHKHFKNIYGLSEEDFKIMSIAHSVGEALQWEKLIIQHDQIDYNNPLFIERVYDNALKNRVGNCDSHSLIVQACLKNEGIESEIGKLNYSLNGIEVYHTFVLLEGDRVVDSMLIDSERVLLFKNSSEISITMWETIMFYNDSQVSFSIIERRKTT